jgi:hypothetical protein
MKSSDKNQNCGPPGVSTETLVTFPSWISVYVSSQYHLPSRQRRIGVKNKSDQRDAGNRNPTKKIKIAY